MPQADLVATSIVHSQGLWAYPRGLRVSLKMVIQHGRLALTAEACIRGLSGRHTRGLSRHSQVYQPWPRQNGTS